EAAHDRLDIARFWLEHDHRRLRAELWAYNPVFTVTIAGRADANHVPELESLGGFFLFRVVTAIIFEREVAVCRSKVDGDRLCGVVDPGDNAFIDDAVLGR